MRYIFIHGLGQNSSSWKETISYMEETANTSHPNLFDFLGDKEPTYNNLYHVFSKCIEEFPGPVSLIGLSLGAVLALNYTIDHPEKIQSLVLIAPQYKMPKFLLNIQNVIFQFIPESSFQKLGSSKREFTLLMKSMRSLDLSKDLKKITCNTLVLYGEKDKANKRAAESLSEQIQKAEIQKIMGAGHELNIDAPEKLASILNDFLDRN